jgi:mannose-6-phosphate isomerase-like protein (cupin superfamily)
MRVHSHEEIYLHNEEPQMTDVSIVSPDGGEQTLTGPVRMRILEDGSTTGHRLGIGEITIAPHTEGPPQHRHGRHDEGFYVVSGTARFTVGDQSYDAGPGTLVMVPPGAPHTFANPSDEPAVLLNTFTPGCPADVSAPGPGGAPELGNPPARCGQPMWRCTSASLDGPGSAEAIHGPGIDGSMMPSSSQV